MSGSERVQQKKTLGAVSETNLHHSIYKLKLLYHRKKKKLVPKAEVTEAQKKIF